MSNTATEGSIDYVIRSFSSYVSGKGA